MLVTAQERPRELKWYHAGPMLYGDWGTSRFYVLGLALFYALHASFYYVFAVGVLVAAVGWAYTIICRCYPDGGGVYSAAKHTNRQLAVVGALLLFADYIVTASISAYDGIRYMGVPKDYVPYIAMGAILLVGVINYIGPRKAGTIALVIAVATLALTLVLTAFAIPHLAAGWKVIHRPTEPLPIQWSNFVAVVLALSGVEAVANMTGIMVPPVTKTANKAIWPVLVEVVVLNLVLAVAMNGLPAAGYTLGQAPGDAYQRVTQIQKRHPDWQSNPAAQSAIEREAALVGVTPDQLLNQTKVLQEHIDDTQDAVLRVMAKVYVDPYLKIFSWISGFVFGALLLSAVNTAVADMVSIQYVMSRDTELPHVLTKLNVFGVPWYALIAGVCLPIGLLCIFQNVYQLANLYAVGVVGAIAINLGSCSFNLHMPVKKWERACLALLAVVMVGIEATLVYQKPDARYFAAFVLFSGLAARFFTKTYPKLNVLHRGYALVTWAAFLLAGAVVLFNFESLVTEALKTNVVIFEFKYGPSAHYATYLAVALLLMFAGTAGTYGTRYLLGRVPAAVTPEGMVAPSVESIELTHLGTPPEQLDMARSHVMVATRGGQRLLDFASQYCKKTNAVMFVLYVRQVNVTFTSTAVVPSVQEDPQALGVFKLAADACGRNAVQMVPIYVVSPDVAYSILDFAATYNVEALLMGVSRKGAMLRALQGDVLTAVADSLPQDIPLLIHA